MHGQPGRMVHGAVDVDLLSIHHSARDLFSGEEATIRVGGALILETQ